MRSQLASRTSRTHQVIPTHPVPFGKALEFFFIYVSSETIQMQNLNSNELPYTSSTGSANAAPARDNLFGFLVGPYMCSEKNVGLLRVSTALYGSMLFGSVWICNSVWYF